MANVRLSHVYKVYPNGHKAVKDFNIDIQDKEFIVFVGPSGCGKSTTLRMIAGLEDITAGELYIGDRLCNHVEPKDRDIAMVFQSYALYPHMTVYDNMAFGLVNQKTPKEVIKERVTEAAKILDLTDYLNRTPKEMSGGQMQRVALGRAIVRHPTVFLLDEPLSNLDAKLRASMRTEISRLHQKLQTTFIYVTHDQVEAMTMGTRIVVMRAGIVQQIDTPINLYMHPANMFVAGFIGTPQMNFFEGTLSKENNYVIFNFKTGQKMKLDYNKIPTVDSRYFSNGKSVTLGVRPDNIIYDDKSNIKIKCGITEQLGNETILYGTVVDLNDNNNQSDLSINENSSKQVIGKLPYNAVVNKDEEKGITFEEEFIHLFDTETGDSILSFEPLNNYVEATIKDNKIALFGKTLDCPEHIYHQINGNVLLEIPTEAFIDGKDINLDLKDFNNNLKVFNYEGINYFVKAKLSSPFNARIDWKKVKVYQDNNLVIDSLKDEVIVPVKFNRGKHTQTYTLYKKKKQRDEFGSLITVDNPVTKTVMTSVIWFTLNQEKASNDLSYVLSHDNMTKLIDSDGRKVFKKTYDIHIPFSNFDFNGKDFTLSVISNISYLEEKYVVVNFNGSNIILPDFSKDGKISFSLNLDNPLIYEHDSDMKMN